MDLEEKLEAFKQKYTELEEQAEPGSVEWHVYDEIVRSFSPSQQTTPALQRALEMWVDLDTLAQVLSPPNKRHIVQEAIKELERIADLPRHR